MGILMEPLNLNLQYRLGQSRKFISIMIDNLFKLYKNPKLFLNFTRWNQTKIDQLQTDNELFSCLIHDINLALL
jgi:hypothetical protein